MILSFQDLSKKGDGFTLGQVKMERSSPPLRYEKSFNTSKKIYSTKFSPIGNLILIFLNQYTRSRLLDPSVAESKLSSNDLPPPSFHSRRSELMKSNSASEITKLGML